MDYYNFYYNLVWIKDTCIYDDTTNDVYTMKLISDFHDFYDYFAKNRNLSDQLYVWGRKTKEIEVKFCVPELIERIHNSGYPRLIGFTLWFCGRIVPIVKIQYDYDKFDFFYSVDDIPNDIVKRNTTASWTLYPRLKQFFTGQQPQIKYWHGSALHTIDILSMHRQLNTPIICQPYDIYLTDYKKNVLIINPELNKLQFWKKMSPFEIFQKLEQFICNELAPRDKRMDKPISDKLKAQAHGFDKHSFRKDKQK